jgi:orotate phosphoribosyltransferase
MTILDYQAKFLQLTIDAGVLKVGGEYKLKSGRLSPYFFNAGGFNTGVRLQALGEAFADAIISSGIEFDILFGPAYKGIPLVASVAMALASKHTRDVPFAFNRKEAKDHGEGGLIVGAELKGRVLLVDDVITAGTAIRESMTLLKSYPACQLVGVAVALDRQEKAPDCELSAIQSVEREFGLKVVSIANLDTILQFAERTFSAEVIEKLKAYRASYGVALEPVNAKSPSLDNKTFFDRKQSSSC